MEDVSVLLKIAPESQRRANEPTNLLARSRARETVEGSATITETVAVEGLGEAGGMARAGRHRATMAAARDAKLLIKLGAWASVRKRGGVGKVTDSFEVRFQRLSCL